MIEVKQSRSIKKVIMFLALFYPVILGFILRPLEFLNHPILEILSFFRSRFGYIPIILITISIVYGKQLDLSRKHITMGLAIIYPIIYLLLFAPLYLWQDPIKALISVTWTGFIYVIVIIVVLSFLYSDELSTPIKKIIMLIA